MTENWSDFLDDVSRESIQEKPKPKRSNEQQILSMISKVAKYSSLNPTARLALIQLLVKDGTDGGAISINTVRKLIGSSSVQTALAVLKTIEERGIINRVRSQQGSTYKFTKRFLDEISQN
jgi:DNA-binding MarR family transcriptional regulator